MDKMDYRGRNDAPVKVAVMTGDLLLCNALFCLACWACDALGGSSGSALGGSSLLQSCLLLSAAYFGCTARGGIVLHRRRRVRRFQIVGTVLRNVFRFAVAATLLLWLGGFRRPDAGYYAAYLVLFAACSACFRLWARRRLKCRWMRGRHRDGVVLVGSTADMAALWHELSDDPSVGYRVCGYFDDSPAADFPKDCPYLGAPPDVIPYLEAHRGTVRSLYCRLPPGGGTEGVVALARYCENHLVRFYGVPAVRVGLLRRSHLGMMGSVPCLSLREEPLGWVENRLLKRAFDVAFSAVFLCTLFVPILLVVTVVTKLTMPGPVFFRQKRTGLDGKEFWCLKFRSMRVNAEADLVQATRDDPRKTRWGDIMRRTNIDELPQFINVLLGDMSVVGPRPHMLRHTEEYSRLIDRYMVRHLIRPGITGWSQVNGFRGETRELEQMEGRVQGDIWYIEHWSFGLDLYIIYKTVVNALRGEKEAY